jgi:hypothetical protein
MSSFTGFHILRVNFQSLMTSLNLHGDGNNIFQLQIQVRAFHVKLFLWQGRRKSGNLAVFPTLTNCLDESNRNEQPAGTHNYAIAAESVTAVPAILAIPDRRHEWIFSPFRIDANLKAKVTDDFQDIKLHIPLLSYTVKQN